MINDLIRTLSLINFSKFEYDSLGKVKLFDLLIPSHSTPFQPIPLHSNYEFSSRKN